MAALRRHKRLLGASALVFLGALLAIWWPAAPRSQAALLMQVGYGTIDWATASEVLALRQDAGLDDDTLACMNLSAPQLEDALAGLRTWYETNRPAWRQARSAVANAAALVRVHRSAIQNGQDHSQELAAAKQQLAQAEAAYETVFGEARGDALEGLAAGPLAMANRMRARDEHAMPYRALDLTGEQDTALQVALNRYRQRLSFARSSQARAQLRQMFEQGRDAALGQSATELASLQEYLGDSSQRVVEALALVFPIDRNPGG